MPQPQVTLKTVYDAIGSLEKKIDKNYVTKDEFNPVRSIVYGMVGLLLSSVFVAVLAQVVKAIV